MLDFNVGKMGKNSSKHLLKSIEDMDIYSFLEKSINILINFENLKFG